MGIGGGNRRFVGQRLAERDHHQRRDEHPRHQPEHVVERDRQRLPPDDAGDAGLGEQQRVVGIGRDRAETLRQRVDRILRAPAARTQRLAEPRRLDPRIVAELGGADEMESVFAHELGHHALAPGTRLDSLKIRHQLARTLVAAGATSVRDDDVAMLSNLWTDLLVNADDSGAYGPYALGLSAHSDTLSEFAGGDGQIGLHGTDAPWSIGQDVSHGCVRVPNDVVTQLATSLRLGTPVTVA